MSKTKVILDTDIGIDIDDTWALGYLLQCPQLDLQMVTTATGDVEYRSRIVAKFLDRAGVTVPIGVGIGSSYDARPQMDWCEDYDLSTYPGEVLRDGVDAMVELIKGSEERLTIICIGPLTNMAEALRRCPGIAEKVDVVSMLGSIRTGLDGEAGKIAEWNVLQDVSAAQQVFAAGWPVAITPLDTCGRVRLAGENYAKLFHSKSRIVQLILENYKVWDGFYGHGKFEQASSLLFDTVAVYMAFCRDLLGMESMMLAIDDEGYMVDDANGKEVSCALSWRDQGAFESHLVNSLLGQEG